MRAWQRPSGLFRYLSSLSWFGAFHDVALLFSFLFTVILCFSPPLRKKNEQALYATGLFAFVDSCASCAPAFVPPRVPVSPCSCGTSLLSLTQTFPFVPVYRFIRVVVCPGVFPVSRVSVFLCWCVPVSACCTCFYARSVPSYAIIY